MPRLKTAFRILRYCLTALTVVVLLLVAWGWWRWNTTPVYWHVTEPAGRQAMAEAERFENWTASQFTAVREGDGRWSARIDVQQINQWLTERAKPWAVNQLGEFPEWLDHPMVALERGRIIVAGHVKRDDFDNIMSLVFEPRVEETDGAASGVVLDLTEIRVGSLGIPADLVLEKVLAGYSPSDAEKIRRTIQHIRLSRKADRGRVVTVEGLQIDEAGGVVTLDCRTARK